MKSMFKKLCALGLIGGAVTLSAASTPAFADFDALRVIGTVGKVVGAVSDAQNQLAGGKPGNLAGPSIKGGGKSKHSSGGAHRHK